MVKLKKFGAVLFASALILSLAGCGGSESSGSSSTETASSAASTEESAAESAEDSAAESADDSTAAESSEDAGTTDAGGELTDYIYFDNSETKWETVSAYWWHSEYARTTDKDGNDYGCVQITTEDGGEGYEPTPFPGTPMEQIEGTDIWRAKVPLNAQFIIFNSSVSDDDAHAGATAYQTADLKFDENENAGQIYTVDASTEPKAGRGVDKTKFKYENGEWSTYAG